MPRKILSGARLAVALVALVSLFQACGRSQSTGPPDLAPSSIVQSSPRPSPQTVFERDLQFIRNGQFAHVWVFSRKDGRPLDKEDAAYLRANAPQVVDWVTTEEGKRVIAGTNFDLERRNMDVIRKRFVVQDYTGK